jgi:hypothetical protein
MSARVSALFLAVACFGGWTVTRRSRLSADRGTRLLRALELAIAIVGVLAVFGFGLALLTTALGTWIS